MERNTKYEEYKMLKTKMDELEKRISRLEKKQNIDKFNPDKSYYPKNEPEYVIKIENLLHDLKNKIQKALITSCGFIHFNDKTPQWSWIMGFDTESEFINFIYNANCKKIAELCSQFTTKEQINIVKNLIVFGPQSQGDLLKRLKISQGQFYHYIKDLISNKLVERKKKDLYNATIDGLVLFTNLLAAAFSCNDAFSKKVQG